MSKNNFKTSKKYFVKGYAIGVAFCGSVALILLIVLWALM